MHASAQIIFSKVRENDSEWSLHCANRGNQISY